MVPFADPLRLGTGDVVSTSVQEQLYLNAHNPVKNHIVKKHFGGDVVSTSVQEQLYLNAHNPVKNHIVKKHFGVCKGYEKRTNNQILTVRVIGERNSGVSYLVRYLNRHLPNVTVSGGLSRGHEWFQSKDSLRIFSAEDLKHVLVLVVSRNPYNWILGMQENPIHALAHENIADWRHFVSKPWTIRTSVKDKSISSTQGAHCQEHFYSGEVLPCRRHDSVALQLADAVSSSNHNVLYPVYEMHPKSHTPFRNIREFRKAKMLNFFNMSSWVPNILFLQIEKITQENGFTGLLKALQSSYSLGICNAVSPPIEEVKFKNYLDDRSNLEYKKFFDWFACSGHWSIENKLGYHRYSHQLAQKSGRFKRKTKCPSSPFDSRYARKW
eukprot:CAMPEP_0184074888 /NCGR_PEP_ID=MMETSP0957-20130417/70819_1 /TAXON_ID=627963 /ORGANISM="Aplanochytrium sp, Strain PBS07" /LENGTH=381 /DNA_ID=CAMNT_0026377261 /DNA_START=264 /DNA_END=1406 /DNA_ORIENTATION=-